MRTRRDALLSNSRAFLKASSSCQDTPQFCLQLRKLSSELRSYWAKQRGQIRKGTAAEHQPPVSSLSALETNEIQVKQTARLTRQHGI